MNIIELLESKGYDVIPKGNNEFSIVCPNSHQHSDGRDSIASFNINIEKKKAHCFACGYRLNEVGLAQWLLGGELDDHQMRILKLKSSMARIGGDTKLTLVDPEPEDLIFPIGDPWDVDGYRGISLETYRKVGAVKVNRGRYANRLVVEIRMYGELVGLDARALSSDMQPKYLRPYNSNAKSWLFPFDLCREIIKERSLSYVLLGEGLFHGLNPCQFGIPSCCYFGANNFSQENVLQLLDLEVPEIIIFPDNDAAGLKAVDLIADMLLPLFEVSVADVSNLQLDEEASLSKGKLVYQDLGDITKEEIEWSIENRKRYKGAKS